MLLISCRKLKMALRKFISCTFFPTCSWNTGSTVSIITIYWLYFLAWAKFVHVLLKFLEEDISKLQPKNNETRTISIWAKLVLSSQACNDSTCSVWSHLCSLQQAHIVACISQAHITDTQQAHQTGQTSCGCSVRYNWPVTCGPTTTKLWLNYWYSGVGRFASGGMKGIQHGNGLLILYGSLRAHSSQWRPNILTYVCRGGDCI